MAGWDLDGLEVFREDMEEGVEEEAEEEEEETIYMGAIQVEEDLRVNLEEDINSTIYSSEGCFKIVVF